MKVKLYKGPFNGKTITHDNAGDEEIYVSGPKPMNRKQRYDFVSENFKRLPEDLQPFPRVSARYRMAVREISVEDGPTLTVPLIHPNGALFYEYIKGSKSEY